MGTAVHFASREEDYLGITEEINEVSQGKGKHRMGPKDERSGRIWDRSLPPHLWGRCSRG